MLRIRSKLAGGGESQRTFSDNHSKIQNGQSTNLPRAQGDPLDKIEPSPLTDLKVSGQIEFFVWLNEKADLSPAHKLKTKEEKGHFVFETLRGTAERSQRALRQELGRQGVRYRPFYIANKILVYGGSQYSLFALAARSDVARITANHRYQLEEPRINRRPAPNALTIEPNLSFVKADEVWALGYDGQGIVLAGNDTGLDWDHPPALINQYRG